mgnify:CR=1 FL=1
MVLNGFSIHSVWYHIIIPVNPQGPQKKYLDVIVVVQLKYQVTTAILSKDYFYHEKVTFRV